MNSFSVCPQCWFRCIHLSGCEVLLQARHGSCAFCGAHLCLAGILISLLRLLLQLPSRCLRRRRLLLRGCGAGLQAGSVWLANCHGEA